MHKYALALAVLVAAVAAEQAAAGHPYLHSGKPHCYTVCAPRLHPYGPGMALNPYFGSPWYMPEQEAYGGPFGIGTLNPLAGTAGLAGQLVTPQTHLYPMLAFRPLIQPYAARGPQFAAFRAGSPSASLLSLWAMAAPLTPHHVPSLAPACHTVCPVQASPRADDEPLGGPFGPDPYYSHRSKSMFHRRFNKAAANGFGNYHNPHHEPFGGPFGPDPSFTYGEDRASMRHRGLSPSGFPPGL